MNFSHFLMGLKTQKGIVTAKDHYESLGGKATLGISLRHFQQIEAGKYPPSEKLLGAVFAKVPASDRKPLMIAYFQSIFGADDLASPLLQYLDQHLIPAMEETRSIWESKRRLMTYSDEQLDYLIQHPDAMRFHRNLMLMERSLREECQLKVPTLKELETLGLVELRARDIIPSRTLYRIPHFDNSSPRSVAKASDYILRHIELYAAKEGSAHQELSYAFQMVSPAVADRILDQLKAFKRWVQALASQDTGPQVRPFLFVGFAKHLDRKEL